MGIGVGAQTGLTFEAGASRYGGTGSSQGNTQVNTYIDGVNSVNVRSGGNTTLAGAVLSADRVTADVGGNLVIESRQDTATATSKESSAGANVSVCIPPFCVGPYVIGSVSGGGAHGSGNFASVSERSGIQAGDGGFDVKVQGNTKLVGGVIASTDAAVDGQKNSLQSGSLTTSDIVNSDSFRASGASGVPQRVVGGDREGRGRPHQRYWTTSSRRRPRTKTSFTRCMLPRSSASARARLERPTSSA